MRRRRELKVYRAIMLDPPWPERGGGKIKRGADRHYELMRVRDMPSAVLGNPAWRVADNAHLYTWATNNYLPDALWLIGELGFRYVTNVVWVKPRMSLGQYFRGKHELLLFAVRGKGKDLSVLTDRRDLPTVIETAPGGRRVHSRKPAEAAELVEARSKGPWLEMFSDLEGPERPGWDRVGRPRKTA